MTTEPASVVPSASSTGSPNYELEPSVSSGTDPVRSGAGGASAFMREAIEKKLAELRYQCGLQRLRVKNAFGPRWSGCQRRNPDKPDSWELHWENLQAQAQIERPEWVKKADKELADFIAEHRAIMGPDWIGNDHGRLCWEPYLGGLPISQHYCQREEGHDGNHADEWPEHRWCCEHEKGSWPQGVTGNHEWNKLAEAERGRRAAAADGVPEKACEQSGANSGNAELSDGGPGGRSDAR